MICSLSKEIEIYNVFTYNLEMTIEGHSLGVTYASLFDDKNGNLDKKKTSDEVHPYAKYYSISGGRKSTHPKSFARSDRPRRQGLEAGAEQLHENGYAAAIDARRVDQSKAFLQADAEHRGVTAHAIVYPYHAA